MGSPPLDPITNLAMLTYFHNGFAAQVLAIRSLRCPSRRLHAMTLLIISDTLHAAFARARQAPHRGA